MKHILLFKIGAIGDVLMTTPFIRQLKKQFPGVLIDYMVGKKTKNILSNNPYIRDIIVFDESVFTSKNIFALLSFFWKIRKMSHYYDAVVIFDKHRIFGLLFKLAGYKKRIWFDRAWKDGKFLNYKIYRNASKREVEYNLDLLALLWWSPDYEDQSYEMRIAHYKHIDDLIKRLKITGKKLIWISTWWGNIITNTVHADTDCRRWSLDNRHSLVNKLLDQWYVLLLLWSSSDRKLNISHQDFHDFRGKYTLSESIALIGKLDKVICHESGFMHLVWCISTSMIVLAWPTNPHRLYPYHHPWIILWKMETECYDLYGSFKACTGQEINRITVQDVLNIFKI